MDKPVLNDSELQKLERSREILKETEIKWQSVFEKKSRVQKQIQKIKKSDQSYERE